MVSPRNKTDEQRKSIADSGGFIGVTMFPAFLRAGTDATVENYVEAIDYVIDLVGENCVGFGTDFTQDQDQAFFDSLMHDKGDGRELTVFGDIVNPLGIRTIGEYPNLTAAMQARGWSDAKVQKVMGENWMRLLKEVWGA